MPYSVELYSSFHMVGRVYIEYAVFDHHSALRVGLKVRACHVVAVVSVIRVTVGISLRSYGSGTLTGTPSGVEGGVEVEECSVSLAAA